MSKPKLAVLLPSRGHAQRMRSVIECLDNLAEGECDIVYGIVCDQDDAPTRKTAQELMETHAIRYSCEPRTIPFHRRLNALSREIEADAYTMMADDVFCCAMHWDKLIMAAVAQGLHAFSWMEMNDPGNPTLIVMSRKWLTACGQFCAEHFPFWFVDTWAAEVHHLAVGNPLPVAQNLAWGGKRGKTSGMRDLRFWFDFFAATRSERMLEAQRVCDAFDVHIVVERQRAEIVTALEHNDAEQLLRVENYEKWFDADQGEPRPGYAAQKAAAERWLVDHGHTLKSVEAA